MNLQFHPIVFVYACSCAVAVFMACLSGKMPVVRGTRVWGAVVLFCAVWSAADGIETLLVDLPDKRFAIRFSYIGVIGTTVFWSFFIIIFSNNDSMFSDFGRNC